MKNLKRRSLTQSQFTVLIRSCVWKWCKLSPEGFGDINSKSSNYPRLFFRFVSPVSFFVFLIFVFLFCLKVFWMVEMTSRGRLATLRPFCFVFYNSLSFDEYFSFFLLFSFLKCSVHGCIPVALEIVVFVFKSFH